MSQIVKQVSLFKKKLKQSYLNSKPLWVNFNTLFKLACLTSITKKTKFKVHRLVSIVEVASKHNLRTLTDKLIKCSRSKTLKNQTRRKNNSLKFN